MIKGETVIFLLINWSEIVGSVRAMLSLHNIQIVCISIKETVIIYITVCLKYIINWMSEATIFLCINIQGKDITPQTQGN